MLEAVLLLLQEQRQTPNNTQKNKTNLLALSSILIINLRWFKFDNFSVLLALIGPLIYTYFYSIELLTFDIAPLVGMISLII